MRNIKCGVADIRRRVFAEVAKLAYEGGDYTRIEKLPYEIVPGEIGRQRESVFLERAIVGERIRLAMGLPLRPVTEHSLLSDGVEESAIAEKYYDPPLLSLYASVSDFLRPFRAEKLLAFFYIDNNANGRKECYGTDFCVRARHERPRTQRKPVQTKLCML